jgi:phasin
MGGFEIPVEMRNMAEHSVVQARQAFDGFMSATQQALNKMEQQASAAHGGAKDAGEKIRTFAEQNVAASFDYAQRLVRAKDVDEMMRIQAEFVQAQMSTLGEQAKELGADVAQATQTAAKAKAAR